MDLSSYQDYILLVSCFVSFLTAVVGWAQFVIQKKSAELQASHMDHERKYWDSLQETLGTERNQWKKLEGLYDLQIKNLTADLELKPKQEKLLNENLRQYREEKFEKYRTKIGKGNLGKKLWLVNQGIHCAFDLKITDTENLQITGEKLIGDLEAGTETDKFEFDRLTNDTGYITVEWEEGDPTDEDREPRSARIPV